MTSERRSKPGIRGDARRRRYRAIFVIEGLGVPSPWRVGPTMIRSASWMRDYIENRSANWPDVFVKSWRERLPVGESKATSVIEVPSTGTLAATIDAMPELVETARDAVGILRLFQRAHFNFDMELQAFGLADDRGSFLSHNWIADRTGVKRAGSGRIGSIGDFTFRPEHRRAFYADPRFQFLGSALATPEPARTEWQRQVLRAVRTVHSVQVTPRGSSRVVAYAIAMEALFGDPLSWTRSHFGEGFRIAQRGSMVSCVLPGSVPRHGPERLACDFLVARDEAHLKRLVSATRGRCSAFEDLRWIGLMRNTALHEAEDRFDERQVKRMLHIVDEVLLNSVDWALDRGAKNMDELDGELDQLRRDALQGGPSTLQT